VNHLKGGQELEDNRVVLFADDSPSSEKARAILREKGIKFSTMPSSGVNIPAARLGSGVFYGLAEISRLAADIEKVRADPW